MGSAEHDRSTSGDDQRRAQLLEAAGRVFQRGPVGGLTIAAVAEEAGVSRRLMYHYFADLQALYDEMFGARIVNHINSPDPEPGTQPSSVAAAVAMAFRQFIAVPAEYRRWTLMASTDTLPAELSAQRDLLFESIGKRWAHVNFFDALAPDVRRIVMSMIVANLCLLATAVDAGHLTIEQATDIAVPAVIGIVKTAHRTTDDAGHNHGA